MPDILDYWVTTDVKFNSAVIDAQAADPGNDFFPICGDPTLTSDPQNGFSLGPAAKIGSGLGVQWHLLGPSASDSEYAGSVSAGTWYTVELHVVYDMVALEFNPQLLVDGSDQGIPTGQGFTMGEAGGDNDVYFGTDVTDGVDGYETDFTNIKIGTSRGGNDIFDGSTLASTVVPPFSTTVGTDAATSLSASGGVLTALANWTTSPRGRDFAVADISSGGGGGGSGARHISVRT
jgi:hypothetical protein